MQMSDFFRPNKICLMENQTSIQQESCVLFKNMPFAATMQKMMGWRGQVWNCATPTMMSQTMAMCCGMQDETKDEAVAEVNQKA